MIIRVSDLQIILNYFTKNFLIYLSNFAFTNIFVLIFAIFNYSYLVDFTIIVTIIIIITFASSFFDFCAVLNL